MYNINIRYNFALEIKVVFPVVVGCLAFERQGIREAEEDRDMEKLFILFCLNNMELCSIL